MNDTEQSTRAHQVAHQGAHYTAQEIADAHGVAESTIRTRWFKWIAKVAPPDLLRDDDGYTELARTLFCELAGVDKKERAAWVADAQRRYEPEWSGAGVIQGELMPEIVGGTLAFMHSTNGQLTAAIADQLVELELFADQLAATDDNYTSAELERYRAEGIQRGLARYRISAQAEIETINALRSRQLRGKAAND